SPPIANSQSVTTNADTPVSITLTGSDPDGNLLLYIITQSPQHGTLQGVPPNIVYIPSDPSYTGSDNFKFKVSDIADDSPEATVTINLTPPLYCPSKGASFSSDWIDFVQLGTMTNSSGDDGGYRFFNNLQPPILLRTNGAYGSGSY